MPIITLTDEEAMLVSQLLDQELYDLAQEDERDDLQEVYTAVIRKLKEARDA